MSPSKTKSRLAWSILLGDREYEYSFWPAKDFAYAPKSPLLLVSGFVADIENSPVPSHPGPDIWYVEKDGTSKGVKHVKGCSHVAWAPSGESFVSSSPLALHKKDVDEEPELFEEGEACGAGVLSWSPDGSVIAADRKGDISFWSAKTKVLLATHELKRGQKLISAQWSKELAALVVGSLKSSVLVVDREGKKLFQFGDKQSTGILRCSPKGPYCAEISDLKRKVRVWDMCRKKLVTTYSGHGDAIHDVCWSPCSKFCASCSLDGTIRIWRADDGAELLRIPARETNCPERVLWSSGGRWLTAICREYGKYPYSLRSWDVGDYASLKKKRNKRVSGLVWKSCKAEIRSIAMAPRGGTLYLGMENGLVQAYQRKSWKLKWEQELETNNSIYKLVLSADGKSLAYSDDCGNVFIADSRKGTIRRTINELAIDKTSYHFYTVGLWFLGRSNYLAVVTSKLDRVVLQVFDCRSGDEMWRQGTTQGFHVAATKSGDTLALARYSRLTVHEAIKGKELWKKKIRFLDNLLWSPDEKTLAIGTSGAVVLLSRSKGKRLWSENHSYAHNPFMSFSPSGELLAVSVDQSKTILIRRVADGKLLHSIEGHHGNRITAMSFAGLGKYIVSVCADQSVRLFDVSSGNLVRSFEYEAGHGEMIALSKDGKILAFNDSNGKCPIWSL